MIEYFLGFILGALVGALLFAFALKRAFLEP